MSTESEDRLSPARLAGAANDAITEIGRQTLWDGNGYEWPSDVYATVILLSRAAHGLGQVVEQAATWLQRQGQAGRVGIDADGTDLDPPSAQAALAAAANKSVALADLLDRAAQHAAHLTGVSDEADSGSEDDGWDEANHG